MEALRLEVLIGFAEVEATGAGENVTCSTPSARESKLVALAVLKRLPDGRVGVAARCDLSPGDSVGTAGKLVRLERMRRCLGRAACSLVLVALVGKAKGLLLQSESSKLSEDEREVGE